MSKLPKDKIEIPEHTRELMEAIFNDTETEIALKLLEGLTNDEISEALDMGDKKVKYYISRIFRKLNVETRSMTIVKLYNAKNITLI